MKTGILFCGKSFIAFFSVAIMLLCSFLSPLSAFTAIRSCRSRLAVHRLYSSYIAEQRFIIEPPLQESNPVFTKKPLFADICKSPRLVSALQSAGVTTATDIQSLAYDHIYNGTDVLIGAETGSGKTFAYILPLIDRYITQQSRCHEHHHHTSLPSIQGVILAPTNSLCDQIMEMSQPIRSYLLQHNFCIKLENHADLIHEFNKANIDSLSSIVCTPRSLLEQIKRIDPKSDDNPLRYLQFMVLDEADMLLDGSYLTDFEKIMEKLKLTRRQMIYQGLLKPHHKNIQHILAAATISTHGTKSIAAEVKQHFPMITNIRSSNMHCHHPAIKQEFIKMATTENTDEMARLTSDEIKEIEQKQLGDNTPPANSYGTIIFLNTAERAQRFAQSWRNVGNECAEVHGLQSRQVRNGNLQMFKDKKVSVLVCTDACARGLDFPHVRAVVQVDFALNIVQHLHRIGRASRAGAQGFAINFYGNSSNDLVTSAIGSTTGDSSGIEKSFSRRRGFRQKLKKGKLLML